MKNIHRAKQEGRNIMNFDVDYSDEKPRLISNTDRYDIRAIFRVRKSQGKN